MIYGDWTAEQRYCLSWANGTVRIGAHLVSSQSGIFPYPIGCINTEIQGINSPNSKAYWTILEFCAEDLFHAKTVTHVF